MRKEGSEMRNRGRVKCACGQGGFGHEISAIERTRNETYTKQILTNTTTDPVKAHINTLRHFWGDGRVRQANSTFIISVDVGGGLGVAEAG